MCEEIETIGAAFQAPGDRCYNLGTVPGWSARLGDLSRHRNMRQAAANFSITGLVVLELGLRTLCYTSFKNRGVAQVPMNELATARLDALDLDEAKTTHKRE